MLRELSITDTLDLIVEYLEDGRANDALDAARSLRRRIEVWAIPVAWGEVWERFDTARGEQPELPL